MTICWITERLGTASATEVCGAAGVEIIDVRDLVDKGGNQPNVVKEKIQIGLEHLWKGSKVVVCCDYGISRSNAVAAGIIAVFDRISLSDAVRLVQEKTGKMEIKLEPLDVVRQAIEENVVKRISSDKRSIMVTGAKGFIGSAVSKRLDSQFNVVAPSRDELDIEQGSTQLSLLVLEHNVDCIIHLANPRIYTSNVAMGKTLIMLRNVLEVCGVHDISLIYPSGWEIYSGYAGSVLAEESMPVFAQGPYGETKYLAELLIQQFQRTFDLRCSVIRSSPVYGVGSDKPKFIHNFINKALRSETITTHRYLNGDAALDLLHIDDFVEVIVRVVSEQYTDVLNVGTGVLTSTKTIAEILKNELGSNSRIEQTQINSHTACIAMNYQRAERALGWQPHVMLQDGLKFLLQRSSKD